MTLARPLILLGMMASGKSTIARWLAEQGGWDYLALDDRIRTKSGKEIPEIFDSDGEEAFRDLESEALADVIDLTGSLVIDPGGGIVDRQANRDILKASDTDRCYINVDVPELVSRIKETSSRPLLGAETDPSSKLTEIATRRDALYREAATYTVRVSDAQPVPDTAIQVLKGLS